MMQNELFQVNSTIKKNSFTKSKISRLRFFNDGWDSKCLANYITIGYEIKIIRFFLRNEIIPGNDG